jgi:hypothetical protein
MNVCVHLFCVCVVLCVGSSLAMGWSPIQGVLLTVYRIKKLKKWLRFKGLQSHRKKKKNIFFQMCSMNNMKQTYYVRTVFNRGIIFRCGIRSFFCSPTVLISYFLSLWYLQGILLKCLLFATFTSYINCMFFSFEMKMLFHLFLHANLILWKRTLTTSKWIILNKKKDLSI